MVEAIRLEGAERVEVEEVSEAKMVLVALTCSSQRRARSRLPRRSNCIDRERPEWRPEPLAAQRVAVALLTTVGQ